MKKNFQIFFILLLFAVIFSCKGQNSPVSQNKEVKKSGISDFDVDPYFNESEAITSISGPKSITRNIIQDRKGDYWLATWEGIIHYDGNVFTNITNKMGLRRYRVFTILEDRGGNIWFGTVGAGIYHYDGKSFTNMTMMDGLVCDRIGCFMEDENGNIWIGTHDGVSKYDGTSFTNFTTKDGLSNDDVNSIIEDKTGNIWFGTRGNACFYDGESFTNFTNKEGVTFANTRTIIEDQEGDIWLGGNDGLWRYDGLSFTNLTTDFVGYIYEDKEGGVWVNSADSKSGNSNNWVLSHYVKTSLPYETLSVTQVKTEENMFFGIMEDEADDIWLGTLNGVYRYDGTSFEDFKNN